MLRIQYYKIELYIIMKWAILRNLILCFTLQRSTIVLLLLLFSTASTCSVDGLIWFESNL